jgi:putative PEP-CTERM system histidine kinase
MISLIALWSHALAALLFGALAIWQLRNWNVDTRNRPLVAAFAVTSAWAIFVALLGPHSALAGITEAGRNFAFLSFMYALSRRSEGDRPSALKLVYVSVAAVIGLQLTIAGIVPEFADRPVAHAALLMTGQVIGLTVAAGSLVLAHNLYAQTAPDSRWGLRLPMIALAGMWAYDLHLFTIAYLTRDPVADLYAMRGAILSLLVPLFALASKRNASWRVQVSRAATFQSISVLAILAYLILMMSATRVLEIAGGNWVRIGQVGLIFGMTVVAVILLPSKRIQAWLRVVVAKHLFEHRYDYRQEWLRFTRTVGAAGEAQAPLGERIIKAAADIADTPAGLLLVPNDNGRFAVEAAWNWSGPLPSGSDEDQALVGFLEANSHVIDLEAWRGGATGYRGVPIPLPASLAALDHAWAGIPLLHKDRLAGIIILGHPLVRRPLDWEDFDLFRTVGIQAASYLAEAHGQEALADARRFDEFNRRFAFILHDIKNLVSQLSLVARNAERHAHNPQFLEDMNLTLQSSVRKMNDLLARLSRGNVGEAEPPRPVTLAAVIEPLAALKRRVHPLDVSGDLSLTILAGPARLEQALAHLVQNAIDASPADGPVRIRAFRVASGAAIEIADEGAGMSADFIRSRLFRPFASTKTGGFGVGAYEARSLVDSMGGRLEVESREGEGSKFTIFLPLAADERAHDQERMRA